MWRRWRRSHAASETSASFSASAAAARRTEPHDPDAVDQFGARPRGVVSPREHDDVVAVAP